MSKRKVHQVAKGSLSAAEQLSLLERLPVAKQFNGAGDHAPAKSQGAYQPCYMTHPPLSLGDGITIYGGSCSNPQAPDADIFIGHDHSMKKSEKTYPWEAGESVLFLIPDMGVPDDKEQFVKMLDWLVVQLIAQKKVHVGCIGGHGRTGMTLSALAFLMLHEKDAISYVRKNYCHKAVESQKQIDFLHDLFGIDKVEPSKSYAKVGGDYQSAAKFSAREMGYGERPPSSLTFKQSSTINPVSGSASAWGRNIEVVKRK